MKTILLIIFFGVSADAVVLKPSVAAKMREEQSTYEAAAGKSLKFQDKIQVLIIQRQALEEKNILLSKNIETILLQLQEIKLGRKKAKINEIPALAQQASLLKIEMAGLKTQIAQFDQEIAQMDALTEQHALTAQIAQRDLMKRFGLKPNADYMFSSDSLSAFSIGIENECSGNRVCYIGTSNHAMLVFGIRFFDPNFGIVRFSSTQKLASCVTHYIQQVYLLNGTPEVGTKHLEQCGGELEVSVDQGLSSIEVNLGDGVCAALSCYVADWVQTHPEKVKGRLCSSDLCLEEFEDPKAVVKNSSKISSAWRSAVGYVDMIQEILEVSGKMPAFSDKDVITLTTFK